MQGLQGPITYQMYFCGSGKSEEGQTPPLLTNMTND